ncbi:hypothetical protein BU14_0025s0035 [Porphyra umbilicalis]|uniref:Asparaginase n=1 Tax=Porphyra umbilicalis TaxID=2786 RepID=A0A1X6PK44_PORUM|nr:hypothetical protein BU14_0025s0035 [Porphyra umbilicalis]|eukprot:OSX81155.1 hypothetical protein BU14_0025s0035 [Porphyra umbilicalis]
MGHTDTIGLLVRDGSGRLAVGVATSGAEFAHPGRVGDAPIVGSGFYATAAGAAAVSGDGDRLLRHLIAGAVVGRLRSGAAVADAAAGVMAEVAAADAGAQAAVVAMDAGGQTAASATRGGFVAAVWEGGGVRLREVPAVGGQPAWTHSCR